MCHPHSRELQKVKKKIQVHLLHPPLPLHTTEPRKTTSSGTYLLGREKFRKQEIPAPKEKSNTQAGIRRKASVCGLQKALRPVETKSKASAAHSYALEEGAEGGTASHDES